MSKKTTPVRGGGRLKRDPDNPITMEEQLRKLLKAEQSEFSGVASRRHLREVAGQVREWLNSLTLESIPRPQGAREKVNGE